MRGLELKALDLYDGDSAEGLISTKGAKNGKIGLSRIRSFYPRDTRPTVLK